MTTDYRDPVFPLPSPTFLFRHAVTVVRASQTTAVDDDGWPDTSGAPTVVTRGYVTAPDPRSIGPAGEATAVDAVVLLARGSTIDPRDQLDVATGQGLPDLLTGRFRITAVRPNASHVRVLVTRVVDPAGAEA